MRARTYTHPRTPSPDPPFATKKKEIQKKEIRPLRVLHMACLHARMPRRDETDPTTIDMAVLHVDSWDTFYKREPLVDGKC